MILHCIVCGKEMEAEKTTKKYCSNKCAYLASRERKKNKKELGLSNSMEERNCVLCSKLFLPKTPAANLRKYCYDCLPNGQTATRGFYAQAIKKLYGAKCQKCGYDKCIGALEFHHLDPTQKEMTISDDCSTIKIALEEAKKCILLCANCHREVHYNLLDISDIPLLKGGSIINDIN